MSGRDCATCAVHGRREAGPDVGLDEMRDGPHGQMTPRDTRADAANEDPIPERREIVNEKWRWIGLWGVMLGVGSCDEDRGENPGFTSVVTPDSGNVDSTGSNPDDSADGPGPGPGPGTSTSDGTTTSSVTVGPTTEFDTLTTDPTTAGNIDPTNTSADTNDTGAVTVQLLPEDMIDDLEDGDAVIYERDGRIGVWYSYNDGTSGTQNPPAMGFFAPSLGGPHGSAFASMIQGSGFTDWGFGFGFDLNNAGGSIKRTFNGSGYTGIAFQARGTPTGNVKFKIQTSGVVPMVNGGTCNPSNGECNDSYYYEFEVTSTWRQIVVPFDELNQGNWGQATPWNPAQMMGLQWERLPTGGAWMLAIDDIGLYQ